MKKINIKQIGVIVLAAVLVMVLAAVVLLPLLERPSEFVAQGVESPLPATPASSATSLESSEPKVSEPEIEAEPSGSAKEIPESSSMAEPEEAPPTPAESQSQDESEGPEESIPSQVEEGPKGGEKKDGKIFVPGFGWVTDEGGGAEGQIVDAGGDFDKQVGIM